MSKYSHYGPDHAAQLIRAQDESEPEPVVIPEGYKAFSEVFGWVPEAGDSAVRIFDNPNAPEMDPNWIWPREETEELVAAMRLGLPCRLVGPTGSGKTKRGFYRILWSRMALAWRNRCGDWFR